MHEKIHHAAFPFDDFERSLDFYTRVLGMQVRSDRPDLGGIPGAWLDMGEQQVHLISSNEKTSPHVSFVVDDLDALVARLRAAGIEIQAGPTVVGPGLARQIAFFDPFGNDLEARDPYPS
jgi:glyoxylase I family protein